MFRSYIFYKTELEEHTRAPITHLQKKANGRFCNQKLLKSQPR